MKKLIDGVVGSRLLLKMSIFVTLQFTVNSFLKTLNKISPKNIIIAIGKNLIANKLGLV